MTCEWHGKESTQWQFNRGEVAAVVKIGAMDGCEGAAVDSSDPRKECDE